MAATIRIEFFEVAPADDEAFVAGRRTVGTLHRALRENVRFRFVEVAPADGGGALYEVAREDGAPDGGEGVVLINPFEVPPEADEPFLAGWGAAREALAAQPGYQGTRLHRSVGAADFRFVNIARWSSPLAFSKAVASPAFREAAGALPFASHPALYLVVP